MHFLLIDHPLGFALTDIRFALMVAAMTRIFAPPNLSGLRPASGISRSVLLLMICQSRVDSGDGVLANLSDRSTQRI